MYTDDFGFSILRMTWQALGLTTIVQQTKPPNRANCSFSAVAVVDLPLLLESFLVLGLPGTDPTQSDPLGSGCFVGRCLPRVFLFCFTLIFMFLLCKAPCDSNSKLEGNGRLCWTF